MALNGTIVESKPREPRVALADIPAEMSSTIDEVVVECAKGDTVYVSYTGTVITAAGLPAGEGFLKLARDYAYGHQPQLAVTGSVNKAGDVRIRVIVKEVTGVSA